MPMSRWFVGSSSSNTSGSSSRTRASAARVRWPPENALVGRSRSASSKPEHGEHRAHLTLQALAAVPVERLARVAVRSHQARLAVGVACVRGRAQLALERAQTRFVLVDARERAGQHLAQRRGIVVGRVLREVAEPRPLARTTSPASGASILARIRSSDDLPAPLPPTSPTFSRSRSTPPSPSKTVWTP